MAIAIELAKIQRVDPQRETQARQRSDLYLRLRRAVVRYGALSALWLSACGGQSPSSYGMAPSTNCAPHVETSVGNVLRPNFPSDVQTYTSDQCFLELNVYGGIDLLEVNPQRDPQDIVIFDS